MWNGMNYRISIYIVLIFTLFSCKEITESKAILQPEDSSGYHSTQHLIEAEELQSISQDDNIIVIDFRKSEEYKKGHIPNALNLWRSDIENKTYPYKGIIADQKKVEKVLSSLGIQQDDIIIIYDDRGLCDAARLWWVLKTYSFENVKLLNGGWASWKSDKGNVSLESPKITSSEFEFAGNRSKDNYLDKIQLASQLEQKEFVLIDTRTVDEYSGKRQKSGATRGGRIPTSINIDWMQAIETKNSQKFKSRAVLEKTYAVVGTSKDNSIVTYCHTGVRSAHTTFVLTELLGYTNVKNYDGSWSEWSYFEELPIEKDSVTSVLN